MSNSKLFLSYLIFLLSFASSSSLNSTHRCPIIQSHALLLFKQSVFMTNRSYDQHNYYDYACGGGLIGSDYHPIMRNWNTGIDCCNWDGVTCDHFTGDVIALDLSCGMLRGTIDPNSTLFKLPHLQTLNLALNDLTSFQLPHDIGRFSDSLTHLNISDCQLSGQVPTNFTILRKLVSLDLSWNYFKLEPHVFYNLLHDSTTLEELSLENVDISSNLTAYLNISTSLKSLNLKSTGLHGELPANIFNLQYLEKLDLSHNRLTTVRLSKVNSSIDIPLKWLDLSQTSLSREIFNSIGHLKSLNHLDLSYTNLLGEIPYSIDHLKSLNTLLLGSCGLKGSLPKSLVNLTNLTNLDLSSNMLNGTFPSSLFSLPSLEIIDLGNNMFTGSLPSELFTLQSLKELYLYNNQLSGEIDQSRTFQQLTNLNSLDLSLNNFRGVWEMDSLLSSLTNLVELVLSSSGLSVVTNNTFHNVNPNFRSLGLSSCKLKVLPESLRAMGKLQYLDVSSNEISGHIPNWAGEIGGNELSTLNLSHNSITGLPQFQWNGLSDLDLQSNLIQGPFPLGICNMSNLSSLDMSNNRFGGVLPQCFGNISSRGSIMDVNLGNNYFHGAIPNMYEGCQLQNLFLNGNQLEGEVPSSLSKCLSMLVLDLHSNKIQGPFPPLICNMENLMYLHLSDNYFSGVIPKCFEKITSHVNLWMVNLGNNYFHGPIPNVFKDCGPFFQGLILNGNQLEGQVPSSLSECESLTVLDLANNRLNGSFPGWLGDLPFLQVLNLRSNGFHGPIETSSTQRNPFPSIQVLDLSHNGFVGHLPGKYFQSFNAMKNVVKSSKKPAYLLMGAYFYYSITIPVKGVELDFQQIFVDYTIVDLSNNRFEGQIPDIIGNLTSLVVLNLSHNSLAGRIPHALGNLSEIESLDLSWNQLIGEIPQSLADLTFLAFLNLSQNHLVGRIPQGKQFNTFEGNSFGGNPKLCGLPLPEKCEHPHEPQLEDDEETESGFTWKVVMLGYGCGTLLGLVMGYLMLSTGKPKWFNAIADAGEDMIHKRRNKRRYVFIGK